MMPASDVVAASTSLVQLCRDHCLLAAAAILPPSEAERLFHRGSVYRLLPVACNIPGWW